MKKVGKENILCIILGYAGVAQLVEQLICNQPVAGSSPITSSNKIKPLRVIEGLFYCSG